MPRSVVIVDFAPSVIVLSAKDPPRLPSPRSSLMIVASGEPWTTTTTACPHRAPRTSTASRHLLRARHPCSSPSSSLLSSSSQNALPKAGGGRPPRNCAPNPRIHVGVVVILRCDATAVIALPILPPNEQRADVDPRHRRRCGCRTPPPPRRGAIIATIERRRTPSARRRRDRRRHRRHRRRPRRQHEWMPPIPPWRGGGDQRHRRVLFLLLLLLHFPVGDATVPTTRSHPSRSSCRCRRCCRRPCRPCRRRSRSFLPFAALYT